MRNESHSELLIYTAAGLIMGAVVVSGLEGGPSGLAYAGALPASYGIESTAPSSSADSGDRLSGDQLKGASAVPNAASCPASNPDTLLTPPPLTAGTAALPLSTRAQNGATLGTGTGCPPAVADMPLPQRAGLNPDQNSAPSTLLARSSLGGSSIH